MTGWDYPVWVSSLRQRPERAKGTVGSTLNGIGKSKRERGVGKGEEKKKTMWGYQGQNGGTVVKVTARERTPANSWMGSTGGETAVSDRKREETRKRCQFRAGSRQWKAEISYDRKD